MFYINIFLIISNNFLYITIQFGLYYQPILFYPLQVAQSFTSIQMLLYLLIYSNISFELCFRQSLNRLTTYGILLYWLLIVHFKDVPAINWVVFFNVTIKGIRKVHIRSSSSWGGQLQGRVQSSILRIIRFQLFSLYYYKEETISST